MLEYKIINASALDDLPYSIQATKNETVAIIESNLLVSTAKSLIDLGMKGIIYTIEHKDILSIKFRTSLGNEIFINMMHENNSITNDVKILDALIGHDHLEEIGLLLMTIRREGFEFVTILPEN